MRSIRLGHKGLQVFLRGKMDFTCFPQRGEDEKLVAMEFASTVELDWF